ncbi:UV-endonuclease UvdE-domain-containing protein [Crassisporium funariophilum]|nr:UV-endonuclease UvdE-domain-containing protein [Crassisporium funariophilum]
MVSFYAINSRLFRQYSPGYFLISSTLNRLSMEHTAIHNLRRSARRSTSTQVVQEIRQDTMVPLAGTSRLPKRKRGATNVRASDDADNTSLLGHTETKTFDDAAALVLPPQGKKGARRRKKIVPYEDGDSEEYADDTSSKPKRARKPREEPVYVIPDIEVKETTFKGRLGYACLNTVMRNKKPASDSVFCSRTCRLDSLNKNGMEWVKDLGRKNVEDLLTIIQWNEDNNIRFFRLSSEMFPFASHGVHGYSLEYCAPLLAQAGALAKKYGHRLTTHPGQYTQLGSPKPGVIEAAYRELIYHCELLDLLGVGPDGVMIVHGGGMYDDKSATLTRIKDSIRNLPQNVRNRLVLENDEMCYNAEDLLPLCEELDVPLVFDYHHDMLYPSSISPAIIIDRANAIWKRRGIKPKQHLSEQRPGAVTLMERRAHADRCENLPLDLPDDMDLMIEVGTLTFNHHCPPHLIVG